MAAFDYAGLRDSVAIPLIRDFGTAGSLLIPGVDTGPNYNPEPGEGTVQAVKLVETSFTKEDRADGNVQMDDLIYLVSTEGVTTDPAMAHELIAAGVKYQIINIKPLRPGPIVMLWKVHVRK